MRIHEHIIRVVGASKENVSLSRNQLWNGLVESVKAPEKFIEHLEGAKVSVLTETEEQIQLVRELDFGKFRVTDQVTLIPEKELCLHTQASGSWDESSLIMRIEEPEEGQFFIRFIYEGQSIEAATGGQPELLGLLQRAYEEKDKIIVQKILENLFVV